MEIIKVLGTPTIEEIKNMNPKYKEAKIPLIKNSFQKVRNEILK